jgi:invasion protein IalB
MRRAAALVSILLGCVPVAAQEVRTLPGGATSIRELRGAWILVCGYDAEARACNLRQEQRDTASGRLVLIMELVPVGDDITGSLVLPLGVDLQKGVTLQVDDHAPMVGSFQACVAQLGCAVPVSLDEGQSRELAAGETLTATFTPVNAQAITYSVSLKGLSGALARAAELLAN